MVSVSPRVSTVGVSNLRRRFSEIERVQSMLAASKYPPCIPIRMKRSLAVKRKAIYNQSIFLSMKLISFSETF